MYKVTVHVTLKPSVLDPQGKATRASLHTLGLDSVQDVRMGKLIQLTIAAPNRERAEAEAKQMCEKLLVNPVVEQYSLFTDEEEMA